MTTSGRARHALHFSLSSSSSPASTSIQNLANCVKMSTKSVFILGTGFIGGSVLQGLLDEGYAVTALSRNDDKAKVLHELGVKTVKGSLSDDAIIRKTVLEHDVSLPLLRIRPPLTAEQIIIHAATADDEPSVKSILRGLSERPQDGPVATYIHTSGSKCMRLGLRSSA